MPWEKQFDVEDALERAQNTFWAEGYEATSMDCLLKRMGINRGSFYDTFGSKRDVLIQALHRYYWRDRVPFFRAITQGKRPRKAIAAVFQSMIDSSAGLQARHGCFLVNSALEIAPKDQEVARIVRHAFSDIEGFFVELVRQGQKAGEIRKSSNAAEMGRNLMNHLLGLMVLVRSRAPRPVLESVVKQAGRLLA
ncbi:MAG TPA: TetR/AcrR family transcriptional regulator [Terriglobales bacterium]|nr:TetR/AcrR family transcriptional regulator [Terriglobales bacterium]